MFKGKPVRVVFSEEALEAYSLLEKIVEEEISKNVRGSEHQTLLKGVERAVKLLEDDPFIGTQIPKRYIPAKYHKLYKAKNLWKVNLPGYWRMIYLVKGYELKVVALVLDIVNHKDYDRIFGYKKK